MFWRKTKAKPSLSRRLFNYLLLAIILAWAIIAVGSYFSVRHEVTEFYDGEMSQLARVLSSLYGDNGQLALDRDEVLVMSPPYTGDDNYENKLLFQVWDKQGRLRVKSSNAPFEVIAPKLNQFLTLDLYGNAVRVYAFSADKSSYIVHVGQNLDIRDDVAAELSKNLLLLILAALILVLLAAKMAIKAGLAPLNTVVAQIARRSSHYLEPVKIDSVPQEIEPTITELNQLLARLSATFEKERQFIADATHELKTPLAAIKAQVQLAQFSPEQRDASLQKLSVSTDRIAQLVDQLLTLSKYDSHSMKLQTKAVDLKTVTDLVLRDLQKLTHEKNAEITLNLNAVVLNADPNMVYVLLRNTVQNAVMYGGDNNRIVITATQLEAADSKSKALNLLRIEDNGPGVAEDELPRLFDRFYRALGTKAHGSGLGLSIVQRIVTVYGGAITAFNRTTGTGLVIEIRLP